MYLVADNSLAQPLAEEPASFAQWEHFPVSELSHHGQACCETARHWFRGMDFAQLNSGGIRSGPRWIRKRYDWGPSQWPLHWCDALNAEVIDCGAHAALAQEAFEARGLASFRAQFVQAYDGRAIDQWRTRWDEAEVSDHWLGDRYIYHEGNALFVDQNEVKLWDGSSGTWLNPGQTRGYGSLLACRLMAPSSATNPCYVTWGRHRLYFNEWLKLNAD